MITVNRMTMTSIRMVINNSLKTHIMRAGKILLGVLAGAAVGASLGVLFAPHKGVATRRKISHQANRYVDDLSEKFNEFAGDVNAKIESIRKDAARLAKKEQMKAEDVIADILA